MRYHSTRAAPRQRSRPPNQQRKRLAVTTSRLPTPAQLRKILQYDPKSGCFTWKPRPISDFATLNAWSTWNSRFVGKFALQSKCPRGYLSGYVMWRRCLAHRAAWAMHYGEWPRGQIDHIDGNPSNNAIKNLRDVSARSNQRNSKMPKNNTSGCVGVYKTKSGKWVATIGTARGNKHIGTFCEFGDAVSARKEAERRHGYHKNHGRK